MKLEDLKEHVDARFDKLEEKVEKFAERTATNENDIGWIKGHVRSLTAILITLAIAATLYALGIKQ